ncbi:DUF6531 domain-containing protein, partial [Methylobacter sp.]|uniref:DUF6531 domain-containing protein n=1 Tax=Methylobacter sp. TaxID=2051955 RepID=UPI0025F66616
MAKQVGAPNPTQPHDVNPTTCNPISIGTGNKLLTEVDYIDGGNSLLRVVRTYNSAHTNRAQYDLAAQWSIDIIRALRLNTNNNPTMVVAIRPDGKALSYSLNGSNWSTDSDINDTLTQLKNGNIVIGWTYTVALNNSVEEYDTLGLLLKITTRNNQRQQFSYSNGVGGIQYGSTAQANGYLAPSCQRPNGFTMPGKAGILLCVTDNQDRQLNFDYDSSGRLIRFSDPEGQLTQYSFDANNNLIGITYPDGKTKNYLYENSIYKNALTGIIDENGVRYATYNYDNNGKAYSESLALGAAATTLNFNAAATTVTDALGTVRTYNFQMINGMQKSVGSDQPAGAGCSAASSNITYDANGNVSSRTDFNGNRTNYSYDLTRNLETSRTEGLTSSGAATPATRTIATVWHPTFRLPVQITNGNQQTSYAYNPQGDLTEKTVKDLATNTARSWKTAYTYSAVPGVLLQKVEDGPRTDVSDIITYDYYPADAACAGGHLGCRGQLKQITDALGHSTQLTRYSPHGQVEQLTDPNGLVTTLTYDLRQRLTSLDV